jgi:MFS family permease
VASVVQVRPAGERPALLEPRDDALVRERPDGDGTFACDEGPFHHYRRQVRVLGDGRVEVEVEFVVRPTFWGWLFVPGLRRRLTRPSGPTPWWAPPGRLDGRGADVLGLLCSVSVVAGYLGTVITQTATFAADEFGASRTGQSNLLSAVRASILIVLVLAFLADRLGRRRLVTLTAGAGCLLTATGALSPSLAGLGISQTVARGFATGLILLIGIVSAEEMPTGSRAWAFSVLSMCQALGAGMCLWFLPLADIGGDGSASWRILYVLPLAFLPVVAIVRRHLPESRRFAVEHVEAPIAGHGARFWMLAASVFLLALFSTPASQLGNDFLKEVRGFSGLQITIFTICTAAPAFIGIVIGGRLADVRGRRMVGAVAVGVGSVLAVIAFASEGWELWAWTLGQNIVAAATVPALGVYRPELFPTSLRGRAAGGLEVFSVLGAVAGLQIVGRLVDGGSSYGTAFAAILVAPLAVVVLVLAAFPETAHRSLEELNPEDRAAVLAREDP